MKKQLLVYIFVFVNILTGYAQIPFESVGYFGGSFNVSPTGGAAYSVPIEIPQSVSGFQPSLSITYNSQGGNGVVGWGCNISGLSAITHAPKDIYHDGTAKGMTFMADDAYLLDGQRMILVSGTAGQNGATYKLESDPLTKIIVHVTYETTTANTWFEVFKPDGTKYYYGNTTSGKLNYTNGTSPRIYAWYIDYAEDIVGNYMNYTYDKSDYFMYPSTIVYGNNKNQTSNIQNTVSFGYETRNDITPYIFNGTNGKLSKRLSTITTKIDAVVHRNYKMTYDDTQDKTATKFSRLTNITQKNGIGESLKPIQLVWLYLPGEQQNISQPDIYNDWGGIDGIQVLSRGYTSADINGDGLTDIIDVACLNVSGSIDTYANIKTASKINGILTFNPLGGYVLGVTLENNGQIKQFINDGPFVDFDGDGINDVIGHNFIDHLAVNIRFLRGVYYTPGRFKLMTYNLQGGEGAALFMTTDIDSDGKGNIIYIEQGNSNGKYLMRILSYNPDPSKMIDDVSINLSLPGRPEKVFASDFNGNGMQDIMVLYEGGYTIYWNQGNGLTSSTFSDSYKATGNNVAAGYWTMIRSGDFNGDGLGDFIINNTNDNNWYFALNNGNGTFNKTTACNIWVHDQSVTSKDDDKFNCMVYDFDGDGKDDVVIAKSMYKDKNSLDKTFTYWMRSTGTSLTQVSQATSDREDDGLSANYVVGDFDGSGKTQLMNFGYNCYDAKNANSNPEWRRYSPDISIQDGKINKFTDNYGTTTSVEYVSLANDSIYTKGTGSKYPFIDYTLPIHGVSSVVTYNPNTQNFSSVEYKYKGLKAHLQGRGLLGFEQISTVDNRGRKTTQIYDPEVFSLLKSSDSPTDSVYSNYNVNVSDNKLVNITLKEKTAIDKLNRTTVTTSYSNYDAYKNPGLETVDYSNGLSTVTNTQYNNLTGNPYILGQVKNQTVTNTRAEKSASTKTLMQYNSIGQLTSKRVYYENSPISADSLIYNTSYQLVENRTLPYVSKNWMNTKYDYNQYGRIKIKTDPLGLTETYNYNSKGFISVSKNQKGLETKYEYDGWDRNTKITYPDGTQSIITYSWDNTLNNSYTENAEDNNKPFPDELTPDSYPSNRSTDKEKLVYLTIPTWANGSWGLSDWDYDKNVKTDGRPLISKTYKTVDIDEYEWTAENLRIKYWDWSATFYSWMNITQTDVDNYAKTYLNNKTIPLSEFENIFGTWFTAYGEAAGYRNGIKVYDKEGGVEVPGWKLPSVSALQQLYGQAPRTSGIVHEDIKDYLFASACDNPYDWGQNMFNRKNISGLTLTPLGLSQNVANGSKYGFGQAVALQTDKPLQIEVISDMLMSGKGGIFTNPESYHFTQARYCREKTPKELGYKLYIDQFKDKVLMLPYDQVSTLPELDKGLERGVALRYANRQYMYILKPWTEIKAEAAEIRSKLELKTTFAPLPSEPCGIVPDPFIKGKQNTTYMTVPAARDWAWGMKDWDYDTNTSTTGRNLVTKTYKTTVIGEYEWTAENLMLKYTDVPPYMLYAWLNITQPDVNNYLENTTTATLPEFENVFGTFLSELSVTLAYRTMYNFYDKSGGALQSGWNLPTANEIYFLMGLAPATSDKPWENIKDFLFASKAENKLNLRWDMLNRNNTSGLGLTPLGMRPNVNGGTPYGFGRVSALKSKTEGYVHILTDMSLSGSKIGVLTDNYNYHFTQARYCRRLSDAELGYKMYIDQANDKVIMLRYNQFSTLPELTSGLERGIALRYANKQHMRVLRKWSQIQAEAANIKSKS